MTGKLERYTVISFFFAYLLLSFFSALLAGYDHVADTWICMILIICGNFVGVVNLVLNDQEQLIVPVGLGTIMAALYGSAIGISYVLINDLNDMGEMIIGIFCAVIGITTCIYLATKIIEETGLEFGCTFRGCFDCFRARLFWGTKVNQVSPSVVVVTEKAKSEQSLPHEPKEGVANTQSEDSEDGQISQMDAKDCPA